MLLPTSCPFTTIAAIISPGAELFAVDEMAPYKILEEIGIGNP